MNKGFVAIFSLFGLVFGQEMKVLPEVVVTGRDEGKWDEEEIDQREGIGESFQELLATVPGALSGNQTAGFLSLRGTTLDGVSGEVGAVTQSAIGVFEDGVPLSVLTLRYLPTPTTGLAGFSVEQGVRNDFAGPAAIAGGIFLETPRPEFSWSGRTGHEYSERETRSHYFTQNIPLLDQELTLRLSYYHFESDGNGRTPNLPDFNYAFHDRERIDAALLWHPNQNKESSLLFRFLRDRSGGNARAITAIVPGVNDLFDRQSFNNFPSRYPAERLSGSLQSSVLLRDGLKLETATSWQEVDVLESLDLDGGNLLNWTVRGEQTERVFSQSVTLSGKSNRWDWKGGLYYGNTRNLATFEGVGLVTAAGIPFRSLARTDTELFAAYGKVSRELARGVTVEGGLRYQYDSRDLGGNSLIAIGPEQEIDGRSSGDVVLPSLGATFEIDEASTLRVSVARGHRAGGVSFAGIVGSAAEYDEESSWDAEVSFVRDVGADLRVSTKAFVSWLEDQQVPTIAPGATSPLDIAIVNSEGTSMKYGAEVEARWEAAKGLSFYANAAWLTTEFDELTTAAGELDGASFPFSPEWSFAIGASYEHESGFFGSVNYSWVDESFALVADPEATALETRSLLSARVGWRWEQASVYLFGANLLDDEYGIYRSTSIPPAIPQLGRSGAPRTVGVGLELSW